MKNNINNAKIGAEEALMRNEYTRLDKLVKKGARKNKRQWREQISFIAQIAADTHSSRDLFS